MTTPIPAADLAKLLPAGSKHRLTIIGGQAIYVWSHYYALSPIPVTGDLDYLSTSRSSARAFAAALGCRVLFPSLDDATPSAAAIPYVDSNGDSRQIDLLATVYGVSDPRYIELHHPQYGILYLLHPIDCVRSKFCNLTLPSYRGQRLPFALAQAQMAVRIASLYLDAELGPAPTPSLRRRTRRVATQLYYFAKRGDGLQVFLEFGLDAYAPIRRWPQMDPNFVDYTYDHYADRLRDIRQRHFARYLRSKHYW